MENEPLIEVTKDVYVRMSNVELDLPLYTRLLLIQERLTQAKNNILIRIGEANADTFTKRPEGSGKEDPSNKYGVVYSHRSS
jgi:hypothetical protein